jgi:dolichol-phosphate mannosyltransferase
MDADFSHDPRFLGDFVRAANEADVVIGSRYRTGVNVINWPISRLLLSIGANVYARWITGLPLADSTGGFKCFRREVLEAIDFDKVRSNGYSFQIEMSFRAWKKGFRLVEIPIVFTDRVEGQSKMNKRIVREAIWMVWWLRLQSIIGRL